MKTKKAVQKIEKQQVEIARLRGELAQARQVGFERVEEVAEEIRAAAPAPVAPPAAPPPAPVLTLREQYKAIQDPIQRAMFILTNEHALLDEAEAARHK